MDNRGKELDFQCRYTKYMSTNREVIYVKEQRAVESIDPVVIEEV